MSRTQYAYGATRRRNHTRARLRSIAAAIAEQLPYAAAYLAAELLAALMMLAALAAAMLLLICCAPI